MNPCNVRSLPAGAMVCLCHGAKAKWKSGEYYCIATDADTKGMDWKSLQEAVLTQGEGRRYLPGPPLKISLS